MPISQSIFCRFRLGPETAILLKEKIDQRTGGHRRRSHATGGRGTIVSAARFLAARHPCPGASHSGQSAGLPGLPVFLSARSRWLPDPSRALRRAHRTSRAQRQQRLEAYMQAHARRLEHYCLQAPDQWFNFLRFLAAGCRYPFRQGLNMDVRVSPHSSPSDRVSLIVGERRLCIEDVLQIARGESASRFQRRPRLCSGSGAAQPIWRDRWPTMASYMA